MSESELLKTIKDVGRNGVISLDVNGQKENVILTDYQSDPLKKELMHIDFLAVDMSKEVTATVRLVLTGDSCWCKGRRCDAAIIARGFCYRRHQI